MAPRGEAVKIERSLFKGYDKFLRDIKQRISSARFSAKRAVNKNLVLLYWDIGCGIVQKQRQFGWGDGVVEKMAKDLRQDFPGTDGFSADNLWRMRQVYLTYSSPEFLEQPVPEIRLASTADDRQAKVLQLLCEVPWGHHIEILKKSKNPAARLYYLRATACYGWSRPFLIDQIKARDYERSLIEGKTHNFPAVLPQRLAEQAEQALKSSYNLEFLGIHREAHERELEGRLIDRVQRFILELGYGFCFIGRQHRLILGDNEYFIDLLFYHRFLKSLVAIELKSGRFEPEYAGKMDFYLNVLNEKERAPDDNPSIGIVLCTDKDDLTVEFSLKTKLNPIGVASYELTGKLPRELKGKVPSEQELRAALLAEGEQDSAEDSGKIAFQGTLATREYAGRECVSDCTSR